MIARLPFRSLRHLLPYIRHHRGALLAGTGFMLAKTALFLSIPWILRQGIDAISRGESTSVLARTALWIVVVSALGGFFLYWQRWIIIGASRRIEYELRDDFFGHLIGLSIPFFHQHRTGDLMARATNDLNAVRDVVGPGLMYAMNTVATVLLSLVLMLRLDPPLTVAVLVPFPIMAVLVARFSAEVHRRSLRVQDEYGDLQNAAQENLAGIRVVQSYVQEAAEIEFFTARSASYLDANLALIRYRSLFHTSVAAVLGVGALVLLWVGGVRVISGALTLGTLVAFMGYLSQLTWPFIATGWVVSLLQRGEAAMERMRSVWTARPEIVSGETRLERPVRGELVLEGVSFSYPGHPLVIRDLDLRIASGTSLAIVGRTGAGKTTLVQLLCRLYDPTAGRITLDGHDLRTLSFDDLRGAIGVVPQDAFLFSDTLAANVRFGREDASDEEVWTALEEAGLRSEVSGFPRGLETRIGERGITLSGGQRQRTALARVLLQGAPVLILDDALASVDKETEAGLWTTLRSAPRSRTLILISHRISTVRDLDQVIVLGEGRIAEQGSPAELLARGGLFAEMARRQQLAEELESVDVIG